MVTVDKTLGNRKTDLLTYFRERATESLSEVRAVYGAIQFQRQASAINKAINRTKDNLLTIVKQKAVAENWSNEETLKCILMITYTAYIVMIECRNEVWSYDYMTFSRRIGELWEPFAKLPFYYPLNDLTLFVPPLFIEVKQKLSAEIEDYIDQLGITDEQKLELKKYYNKVWSLVVSGEIQLELDLHFEQNEKKFVVDYKSGFSSNEKGNTNRLLLVATIYRNLEENYRCLLFVRAEEDKNNHYFRTLKNSGIWEAYCGNETYAKIQEYSGFNLKQWIEANINWTTDFKEATMQHLSSNRLDQYLKW
jgi:hypothetical protein